MFPVEWCNLCNKRPATGILTGYFADLQHEVLTVRACNQCAAEAVERNEVTHG